MQEAQQWECATVDCEADNGEWIPAEVLIIVDRDDCEELALGEEFSEELVDDTDNESELGDSRRQEIPAITFKKGTNFKKLRVMSLIS